LADRAAGQPFSVEVSRLRRATESVSGLRGASYWRYPRWVRRIRWVRYVSGANGSPASRGGVRHGIPGKTEDEELCPKVLRIVGVSGGRNPRGRWSACDGGDGVSCLGDVGDSDV